MNIKLYAVGDYPDIELNFKKEELINCQNIYAKLKSFTSGYVIRAKMAKTVAKSIIKSSLVKWQKRLS